MPRDTPKLTPLTEDEAATWLSFATLTTAEVTAGPDGDVLVLDRDDGARLLIGCDEKGAFVFRAEGATV